MSTKTWEGIIEMLLKEWWTWILMDREEEGGRRKENIGALCEEWYVRNN